MGGLRSVGRESSSEEEEEERKWKAAVESIATTTVFGVSDANRSLKSLANGASEEDGDSRFKPKKLTHADVKALKLLDEMVEKTLEFVKEPIRVPQNEPENDGGVRLFKRAPVGIIFDHLVQETAKIHCC